jgi:hypothetical protein
MAKYWDARPQVHVEATPNHANDVDSDEDDLNREFAHYRQTLVSKDGSAEGWAAELRRYLNDMPADVNKDMNIVEYWQVWSIVILSARLLMYFRITITSTRHLDESRWTFSLVKHPQCHASGFSHRRNKSQMIDGHALVQRSSKNCR